MKIAYIYPEILPDNKARAISVIETANALSHITPTTLIYERTKDRKPPLPDNPKLIKIPLSKKLIGVRSNKIFNYHLDNHLRKVHYDILYIRHLKAAYNLLRHKSRYPYSKLIFECHEIFSVSNKKLKYTEEYVYANADGLVFINYPLKKTIQDYFQTLSNNQEIIDNGCSFFLPYSNKSFYNLSLTYIGSFHQWKGVDFLIDCMQAFPNIRVNIIGDGPRRTKLESKVKKLRLEKNIFFLGYRQHNEIKEILKDSTLTVIPNIPSTYDSFSIPIKLYEYLAASTIVIAAATPTIMEIITNGKNGFLFEPGNKKSFIRTLSKILLLGNDELAKISKNAYRTSREYTWEKRGSKILKFSELIHQTREQI